MNRHLTLDGASVNSDLCSDHHCNGWTQAMAEKDALLAQMAGIIHDSRCDDDCRKFAFECIAFGECKCAKGKVLAKHEVQK